MSLKRTFRPIILYTMGFMFFTLLIISFIYRNNKIQTETCKGSGFICGTENPILSEDAEKGKKTFNSYCAACHKLDARSTGPALRLVDSVRYWTWLTPKKIEVDSLKLEKLGMEYHQTYFYDHLKMKDLQNVYKYTRTKKTTANSGFAQ